MAQGSVCHPSVLPQCLWQAPLREFCTGAVLQGTQGREHWTVAGTVHAQTGVCFHS